MTGSAVGEPADGTEPDYADELRSALSALEGGDSYGAIRFVEPVLERHPDLPEAIHILGLVAYKMDEPGRARELLETAHRLNPACLETADTLAILYAKIGNLSLSTYYGKLVTALRPHPFLDGLLPEWLGTFAEAFLSISESRYGKTADRMVRVGDIDGAVEMYRKEAEAHPNDADAQRAYARALLADERPYEALMVFQGLGRFTELSVADEAMISNCLSLIGRPEDAARIANGVISEAALSADVASVLVGDIPNDPNARVDVAVSAEIGWANAFMPAKVVTEGRGAADTGVLKIGFVTGRAHSRGGLECFWPLMSALALRKVAVHVYALRSVDDPIGRRLRGTVASWVDCSEVDDETLCAIIRNDGIHVLIDLDGHGGSGRPRLFLHRPAPVAMRAMGLPGSASAQGFDLVLGDEWIYPASEQDDNVCRIEGGLFRVPGAAVSGEESGETELMLSGDDQVAATLAVGVTASRADVTDALWSGIKAIADAVPDVRFVFSGRRVGGDYGSGELVETAESLGLADRIQFTEDSPSMTARDFVVHADIILQLGGIGWPAAFAEAVGLGRPLVICPGAFPSMRLGPSVAGGLGMDSVVVQSFDEAVSRIVALLNDEKMRESEADAIRKASETAGYEAAAAAWADAFHQAMVVAYRRKTRG